MRHVIVRYSEIGTKSEPVRSKMLNVLRQRVVDRLKYEDIDFEKASEKQGRIIIKTENPEEASEITAEVPGVESTSPCLKTGADVESIRNAVRNLEVGDSFAVRTNRAGEHDFSSQDINREIGSFIQKRESSNVDLEEPETRIGIDIRFEAAFIFSEILTGPGGLPVGTEEGLAALVSGGIDSPVAAYEVMKRGSDILPVYFFNRPIAAEDHLMRFKSSVKELKKFHPSRKWHFYLVDMEEINHELMKIDRGRMIIHRRIMFRVAEHIARIEGLKGIVTGESLGQKSSQTPSNLQVTSRAVEEPVHRPLLGWNKKDISEKARHIGTFKSAEIKSACRTLAPENPATKMDIGELKASEEKVGMEDLREKAIQKAEKRKI